MVYNTSDAEVHLITLSIILEETERNGFQSLHLHCSVPTNPEVLLNLAEMPHVYI